MSKDLGNKRHKVWLEEVLTDVGVTGIEEVTDTDSGLVITFEPTLMSISQTNEMLMLAERDELFRDYYVDTKENKVFLNY